MLWPWLIMLLLALLSRCTPADVLFLEKDWGFERIFYGYLESFSQQSKLCFENKVSGNSLKNFKITILTHLVFISNVVI